MESSPYLPLEKGQSRLMTLLPGQAPAPLQCVLRPFCLHSPPQYEALSYTWGKPFEEKYSIRTGITHTVAERRTGKLPVRADRRPRFVDISGILGEETLCRTSQGPESVSPAPDRHSESDLNEKYVSCEDKVLPEPYMDPRESNDEGSISTDYAFEERGPHEQLQDFNPERHDSYTLSERFATANTSLDGYLVVGCNKIPLRPNLEQALRHLRQPDLYRTLWIDAICIHQTNDDERGYQVSQMGRIFKSATAVFIWLGMASQNSDEALQFVSDLWKMKTSQGAWQNDTQSEWMVFKANFAPYGYFTNERLNQLRALSYLVNRTWFHRRWVVQEVAFAANIVVQCGQSKVSWSEFANTITFLHNHHPKLVHILHTFHVGQNIEDWALDHTLTAAHAITATPDLQARTASQFLFITSRLLHRDPTNRTPSYLIDISTLVTKLWALKVSDPRDTVFALFSLARDAPGSNDLYPDYTKSTCEVFVDLVEHVVFSTQSLDIILRPWAPSSDIIMPSWISVIEPINRVGVLFQGDLVNGIEDKDSKSRPFYAASGQSRPSFRIYRDNFTHMLDTKGFVIGSVVELMDIAHQGKLPLSWRYAKLNQLWPLVVGGKTLRGDKPPLLYESNCRALFKGWIIGGLDWHGPVQRKVLVDVIDVHQLINVFHGSTRHEETLPKEYLAGFSQTEETLTFLERLRVCTWNRRLIRISDGGLGLAPARTRLGDIICILLGCSLPVILRSSGRNFTVIGEVYVHGMSDGEAMKGLQESKYSLQNFCLI